MTVSYIVGSQVAVLGALQTMLRADLGAYLAAIATGLGLTLPDPSSASIYLGGIEVEPGVWPSIGLYIEDATYTPMQSAEEERVMVVMCTVLFTEGGSLADDPAGMYRSAIAYCEAIAQCLQERAVIATGAIGVWRSDKISVHAAQSPAASAQDYGRGLQWVVSGVAARIKLFQAIARGP